MHTRWLILALLAVMIGTTACASSRNGRYGQSGRYGGVYDQRSRGIYSQRDRDYRWERQQQREREEWRRNQHRRERNERRSNNRNRDWDYGNRRR